ncbi:hypothetical protein HMPREF9615_00038 [Cutibacterium acnes HL002PA3]|nr:hypothetical protein HMPREF9576_00386 [Cutibacterium acnes HL110PA2]EFS66985.1 hypothetical protein HMPREF9612_00607 [Cutibacterium acnes HL063PA2]EFS96327.1 hypothetical protein HMPREF9608_00029 [Cutibacterium acnes HL067PA1]EFT08135.1 hypothetical protein HMPREF9618_01001 [Cutibacterium acnes HL082PA1]EFT23162.1 hypothetical protein HMPREF9573_01641 [Cutibacterium acnes HL072PA2]EFT59453.1 hypothetical protein HMPREF9615_00038 [Cutibacterium acnes HL002PA3]
MTKSGGSDHFCQLAWGMGTTVPQAAPCREFSPSDELDGV